jgi:hypothetical protein
LPRTESTTCPGHEDGVGHRAGHQLQVAGLVPRPPGVDDVLVEPRPVAHDKLGDVERHCAVDERVVGLGHHGEAVVLQPLDEVDLPERVAAVERPLLDPGDELLELLVGAGPRQGRPGARGR